MTIASGDAGGWSDESPHAADQWLYIPTGKGVALVNDRPSALTVGTLLFIERKDRHEINSTGRALFRTLDLYVPPGYTKGGEELPRKTAIPRA